MWLELFSEITPQVNSTDTPNWFWSLKQKICFTNVHIQFLLLIAVLFEDMSFSIIGHNYEIQCWWNSGFPRIKGQCWECDTDVSSNNWISGEALSEMDASQVTGIFSPGAPCWCCVSQRCSSRPQTQLPPAKFQLQQIKHSRLTTLAPALTLAFGQHSVNTGQKPILIHLI